MYFRRLEHKQRLVQDVNPKVLYHLENGVSSVACISSTLKDLHRRFDHPTLQILKKLILELGQVSSLEHANR